MLVVRPKISELTFRLFARSLHPELFQVFKTRFIQRTHYQARIDITSAGHTIGWQSGGTSLAEVASSIHQPLPQQRQVLNHPLVGAHQDRVEIHDSVLYQCSFRLDYVEPRTLLDIHQQFASAGDCEGLLFHFQASGRMAVGGVSYVNIQSRERNLRIRAFHTFPDTKAVVTTESTFIVRAPETGN